jgi:cyclic pyranopterin phosphate synthase
MKKKKLTHVTEEGQARMVDVGGKEDTERYAVVRGRILISKELLSRFRENSLEKGDALTIARIAGIQGAKKTAELIPLCHPIPLTSVSVDLKLVDSPPSVEIKSTARARYKTGVEMEALTGAAVAALTIYDMGKAIDRGMVIESIELVEKSGGRSGHWKREERSD